MRLRLRFICLFLLTGILSGQRASGAADDADEIFLRARRLVAKQLVHTLNYACVQTIQRSFYILRNGAASGCAGEAAANEPFMKDRLRLDVAISKGQEIYSWHGEAKFSSTRIADIVRTGPSSSGSFFGFLANIFVKGGVHLSYTGRSEFHGIQAFTFSFVMPRQASAYRIDTGNGDAVIPYHGMFAVSTTTYELVRLEIRGDEIPPASNMCSAETDIGYQTVNIAGNAAVIPGKFDLWIEDLNRISTLSQSEYTECREFRGESTLLFDSGNKIPQTAAHSVSEEQLPSGLKFHVALKSSIDDRSSSTGDAVEAVLLDPLKNPGLRAAVPKGAILHGLIEKFELRYTPHPHYFASILFDRLTAPDASYTLKARPITSSSDIRKIGAIYGLPLNDFAIETINRGVIVSPSPHIHLERRLSSEWITLNVHQPLGSP